MDTKNCLSNVSLSQSALINNYLYLSSLFQSIAIAPVLKSNAYGHGLLEIATILDQLNAPFFCVNNFDEAVTLYSNGIKTPIHIMGYVTPEDIRLHLPFSFTLFNYDQLSVLNTVYNKASIHVFIDTGMHREGFGFEKLAHLFSKIKECKNITVTGIMSHLASGDKPESDITKNQLRAFSQGILLAKEYGISPQWTHIFASTGLLSHYEIGVSCGNIARIGKALYGIDPRYKNDNLEPILSLQSKIVQIKSLNKNENIGYNETFKTIGHTVIGIIPLGYYDGIDRRLSNKGIVLIDGVTCPIVGRVSMNMTAVDITLVKNQHVGMNVTVISNILNEINSINSIAAICDTIPYDVVTRINKSIIRILK